MPYIKVQTNSEADDGAGLLKKISASAAAALGKPESYVQTSLEDGRLMTFGGSTDPTAFIECKSIGLPEGRTGDLSALLCSICSEDLGIPANRIYIEFIDAAGRMWGWNGGTF